MIQIFRSFLWICFFCVCGLSDSVFASPLQRSESCVSGEYIITRRNAKAVDLKALETIAQLTTPSIPDILSSSESMIHLRIDGAGRVRKPSRELSDPESNQLCVLIAKKQRIDKHNKKKNRKKLPIRRISCGCNALFKSSAMPNDLMVYQQWGIDQPNDVDMNIPQALDLSKGSAEVVVAIVDSGVDYLHPDLYESLWRNPWEIPNNHIDDDLNGYVDDYIGADVVDKIGTPQAQSGHGTHVAGIAAAVGNNQKGIFGVASGVKILPIRALNANSTMYASQAIAAIDYVTKLRQRGVNIVAINASWGGLVDVMGFRTAIERAVNAGIIIAVAAGNAAKNIDVFPDYPASYEYQSNMAIASIDKNGALSSFSNTGSRRVALAAPGEDIISTVPNNGYQYKSGTSMAAPMVTGLVALYASYNKFLTNVYFLSNLKKSLKNLPSLQGKTAWGGIPDAAKLLQLPRTANAAVKGKITINGTGLSRVGLYVWRAESGGSALSDAQGNFALSVDPGTYSVIPFKPGIEFTPAYATISVGSSGAVTTNFTAQQIQGVSRTGRVVTNSGTGITGALVTFMPTSPNSAMSFIVETDSNGAFTTLPILQYQPYVVTVSKAGYGFAPVRPTITADAAVITITARSVPTSSVSGIFSIGTRPLAGVRLALENNVSGEVYGATKTAEDGSYQILNIVNGTYDLRSEHPYLSPFTEKFHPITVLGASTFNYNSPTRYTISGAVRYPDYACYGPAVLSIQDDTDARTVSTDQCGRFSFTSRAGRYTIKVNPLAGEAVLASRVSLFTAPILNYDFIIRDPLVSPPQFISQPLAAVGAEGSRIDLAMNVRGQNTVYRWFLDGGVVSSSAQFSIPVVTREMYGSSIEYLAATRGGEIRGGPLTIWPTQSIPPTTVKPTPTPSVMP